MQNKLEKLIKFVLTDTVKIHVPSTVWNVMPITHTGIAYPHEYRVMDLIEKYIHDTFCRLVGKPLVLDEYFTKLIKLVVGSKRPVSFVIRQGYSWYNVVISFQAD